MSLDIRDQCEIPCVSIGHDWAAFQKTRPGNHRRSRQRHSLGCRGRRPLGIRAAVGIFPAWRFQSCSARGSAWKTKAGRASAVRRSWRVPGILDFFEQEARCLARHGHLCLHFLRLDGRPIAFCYTWRSKGCYFLVKTGYDAAYSKFGPGQQLIMCMLERIHKDPGCDLFNFWGCARCPGTKAGRPINIRSAAWSRPNRDSSVADCLEGYRAVLPTVRRFRNWFQGRRQSRLTELRPERTR